MKISIGKAAAELGVTRETLRRWESTGKIASSRTPNGHRRYDLFQLRGMIPKKNPEEKRTVAYARVSSHDQKSDLARQVMVLESYCANHGWKFEVVQDLGSGLNYNKKGLRRLIKKYAQGLCNALWLLTRTDYFDLVQSLSSLYANNLERKWSS